MHSEKKPYPVGQLCSLSVIKRHSSSFIHEVYIIAAVAELVLAGDPHEKVCRLHTLLALAPLSCEDPFWVLTQRGRSITLHCCVKDRGCVVNKGQDWDIYVKKRCQSDWDLNSVFRALSAVGGALRCFQTQADSFEAVIRASSSPLVMNPTRAEVTRDWRDREGWQEWKQQVYREGRPCIVISL